MPRVNCEPGDEETFDLVAEPDNKAFKVNFAEFVQYLHNTKYRSGVSSLITLDDTLMTAQYSLVYTYNCPYAEMLDRITGKLRSSSREASRRTGIKKFSTRPT